jgi:hypothetical protein
MSVQLKEKKDCEINSLKIRYEQKKDKVRSNRINLEGNTHAQEINVSQLPV